MAETTIWYRNIEQDTIHEVVKGSDNERRIRRAQIEIYEDGSDEPIHEPAYEKISEAELKAIQKDPTKIAGYPGTAEDRRLKRLADEKRKADRDEAMDNLLAGKVAEGGPTGGLSEDEVQKRIDDAVAAAVAKLQAANTPAEAPAASPQKGK